MDPGLHDDAIAALLQIESTARGNFWDAHPGVSRLASLLLRAPQKPAPIVTPFVAAALQALAPHADQPKELGHDVIYTAYVIRAVQRFEIEPWPTLQPSLARIVRSIKASGPGWITINGRNEVRLFDTIDPDSVDDPWAAFARLDRPRQMEAGDLQLGHVLTHGHAIEMLRPYADAALIDSLRVALRRRIAGLKAASAEQTDPQPLPSEPLDPRKARYWDLTQTRGDMQGHAIKYAFSFLDLRPTPTPDDVRSFSRILWP